MSKCASCAAPSALVSVARVRDSTFVLSPTLVLKRTPALSLARTALLTLQGSAAAKVFHGDVLVGVDSLGEVVLAIDQVPTDGFVDFFALYSVFGRLDAWSRRLPNAQVVVGNDSITLFAPPDAFGMYSCGSCGPGGLSKGDLPLCEMHG